MAKTKVRVTNNGKRVRERLGTRFLPNKEEFLEVNNRQYLTLKAVKDFTVEIIQDEEITKEEDTENEAEFNPQDVEVDYYDLTIDGVLEAVENGAFTVEEAIALEVSGKNRVTLLEKLEELKQG